MMAGSKILPFLTKALIGETKLGNILERCCLEKCILKNHLTKNKEKNQLLTDWNFFSSQILKWSNIVQVSRTTKDELL